MSTLALAAHAGRRKRRDCGALATFAKWGGGFVLGIVNGEGPIARARF
jgi:hypothetical protein